MATHSPLFSQQFAAVRPPHAAPLPHPLDILLVEDNASDALLLRLSLDASCVPYKLRTLRRGDEVVPWLAHERKKGGHALPDVMLLDLGLPSLDGFEVLTELAAEPGLRAIPIVILTGYEHFEYVRKSYNLWIPAYLTKPPIPEQVAEALECTRTTAPPPAPRH